MKIETSWCTERDPKIDKINSEYVKKVEFVKDDEGRTRETGEIDFLKLPRREFIRIFKNLSIREDCRLKRNYDENKYLLGDFRYGNLTDEMWDFEIKFRRQFKMYWPDLFKLFYDYVIIVESKDDYKNFVEILNSTCRLTYRDYDGYEYSYYTEHPRPKQEDIDHNYIGSYSFVIMKPMSLKFIKFMKDEVEGLNELQNEDQILEK